MNSTHKLTIENRLKGELPRIGIRPVLEGRTGGVRESLECQTLQMAQNVKYFLEKEVKHANGLPVQCIIADSCIGGVAEAMEAEALFIKMNVQISITVTPCWCYGTEVMDSEPFRLKAIWGYNGTERPGAVYLAAAVAGYNQKGYPVFAIYGKDVQDRDDNTIPDDVRRKLLIFSKAALAAAEIRNKSYLSIGGVSMGIAGSIVNEDFFQKYLGMRNEYVDMSEVYRRIEKSIFDKDEYEKARIWVQEHFKIGKDLNEVNVQHSDEKKAESLENSIKMTLIVKDLMVGNKKLKAMGFCEEACGHNAIVAGFQGQRNWTDFLTNGDFMEAVLNSSFDWNGVRQPFIIATENDSLNGISMLFMHLITGAAQIFSDVRSYWSSEAVERVSGYKLAGAAKNGFIHMINSGPAAMDGTGRQTNNAKPFMKPFWDISDQEVEECIDAIQWSYADVQLFPGGGYSTDFTTEGGMPVTVCRLNIMDKLGPFMQIAEGTTINLPEKVEDLIDERTNPTWPTTWFVPNLTGEGVFKSVYSVMNAWGSNHAAICAGHIGTELIALCAMLRIPVSMHNIPDELIYRPRAWDAFGTKDLEAADFSACRELGSLYG